MSTINLVTCDNIHGHNAREFSYPTNITGAELLSLALQNLQIPQAKNIRLLLRRKEKTYSWIKPDKEIEHYRIHDGMTIFILKTSLAISVMTTDGSSKKLMIDLTKTVKELVAFIAEKLRIGNATGYCLYSISENGEHIPLNLDLSLPQQCTNYEKVFFKRRYFVFTKSQIVDRASALLIYNDVSDHIKKNGFKLTNEQKAELCYYSLYAVATETDEVSEKSIPPDTEEDIKKTVAEFISSRKKPTKEEAIAQYLTVAHSIPNFGCEIFKCKYAAGESKDYAPSNLYVGPSKIDLYNSETNELIYSIPYYRYVSVHESKNTITLKFLLPEGNEYKLKFHTKSSNTLLTMISAYASIIKDIGPDLITDGFTKDTALNTDEEIDNTKFTFYYTLNALGKYIFYPGTTDPYQANVLPILPKFDQDFHQELEKINTDFEKCSKDMYEQPSILNLIFNTNEIIEHGKMTAAERDAINAAIYMISTSNITVSRLETLLSSLDILISCQKLIRSEIMIKVESKKKTIIENWVSFLKKYKETFQESLKALKACPTDGTTLYNTQFHLIHLLGEMKSLTAFAESVIPLAPGSSFLPAIEHFTILLKDTLRPLIPHEPLERLNHIYQLHQTLFAISILLSVGNAVKNEQKITSNPDLFDKIENALLSLGNSYSIVQETCRLLTIRPFSIPFIEKLREQIIILQRSVLNCKGISELASSVISDKIFQQALIFAKKRLDSFSGVLDDVRIDPFRDIPTQQQVKLLHDNLVETIVKFLNRDVKWNDEKSHELYENVKNQCLQLKTIITILKRALTNPTRSVFIAINKTYVIIKDIMKHIRELSTILADATLIHYFNNIIRILNEILANHVASFDGFHELMNELHDAIEKVNGETINPSELIKNMNIIIKSPFPDRQIEKFQEIRRILFETQNSITQVESEKYIRIKEAVDLTDLIILCINQLPDHDTVQAPSLVVIPFFSGKETKAMIDDFIPQIEDISNFFSEFSQIKLFSGQKNILAIMKFWKAYFTQMKTAVEEVKGNDSLLLSKIKEIARKKYQLVVFTQIMIPYLTETTTFSKQLDIFFANAEMIIDKIIKPHIQETEAQIFIDAVTPVLSQVNTYVSHIKNPDLASKVRLLQNAMLISTDTKSITNKEDVKNIYQMVQNIIPSVKEDPSMSPLVNILSEFQENLEDMTHSSVLKRQSSSTYFHISTEKLQAIFKQIDSYANIPQKVIDEIHEEFKKFSDETEFLSKASCTFIKAHEEKRYYMDEFRVLIQSQSNKEQRNDQLRQMTIGFAVAAAKSTYEMKKNISEMGSTNDNPKLKYYLSYLENALELFNPNVLISSKSFPSVSLAYNALTEIRCYAMLVLRETNDPKLSETIRQYIRCLDETELTLSLYFFSNAESVIKAHLIQNPDDENTQQSIALLENPSNAISSNFINLSFLASYIQEVDVNDQMKDFKLIIQDWLCPLPEFSMPSYRMMALSLLTQSKTEMELVYETLLNDTMKVPMLLRSPLAHLSFAVSLSNSLQEYVEMFMDKFNEIYQIIYNIDMQYNLLCNEEKAYKADIKLQAWIPQLMKLLDELISELEAYEEPDYTQAPELTVSNDKQLGLVLTSMEGTQFYDQTKEIVDYIKNDKEDTPIECNKTFNNFIEMLPTYTSVPLEEVQEETVTKINNIIGEIRDPETNDKQEILEQVPPILTSFARIIPTIKEEPLKVLDVSMTKVMGLIKEAYKEDNSKETMNEIQDEFKKISSFIESRSLKEDEFKDATTNKTIELINSISKVDKQEIHDKVIEFKSLQASAIEKNVDDKLLTDAIQVIEDINKLSDIDQETLAKPKEELIVHITDISNALTKSITNVSDSEALLDVRTDNNLFAQNQTEELDPRKLLLLCANICIMTQHGIKLNNDVSTQFYNEYINLSYLSIKTLSDFIKVNSNNNLRLFRRYVDNIGDIVDDLDLEHKEEELTQIKQLQKNVLISFVDIIESIQQINASFANSKLKESFLLLHKENSKVLLENIENSQSSIEALLKINTTKSITEQITKEITKLKELTTSFVQNSVNYDLEQIISGQFPLFELINNITELIEKTTDIVSLPYEPEIAAKLPNRIQIPHISTESNLNPQETGHETISIVKETQDVIDKFEEFMKESPENVDIVKEIDGVYKSFDNILIAALKNSIASVNLKNKIALSAAANTLCNSFEMLNKSIKARCQANPNWHVQYETALKDIREKLQLLSDLSNESISLADYEDATLGELRDKILAITKPLQELTGQFSKMIEATQQQVPTNSREFTLTLLNLCVSGASAFTNIMLYAKEHPKDYKDLDESLEKGHRIVEFLRTVNESLSSTIPTIEQLIEFSQQLSSLFGEGMSSLNIDPTNSEGIEMKEQLTIINTGFKTLHETMEKSRQTVSSGKSIDLAAAREQLMKRLQLESRVHFCRFKLEFLENRMNLLVGDSNQD